MKLLQLNHSGNSASIFGKENNRKTEIVKIKLPIPRLYTSPTIPIEEAFQLELFLGGSQHLFYFEGKNLRMIADSFHIRGDAADKSVAKFLYEVIMEKEIFLPEFLQAIFIKYFSSKESSLLIAKSQHDYDLQNLLVSQQLY
jgi:hypothetical protein